MKKRYLILLFFFVLVGCSMPVDVYDVVTEHKALHIQEVGDIVKTDLTFLDDRYEYDSVEFHSTNTEVVRINYKEELLALRSGKAEVKAKLYKKNDLICVVEMGTYFVVSPLLEDFKAVGSVADLQNIKPNGLYYLDGDIEVNDDLRQISHFEGILLNPEGHKITKVKTTGGLSNALFKNVNNAYISGVNFEGFSLSKEKQEQHVLAEKIVSSYIQGVTFNGNMSGGYRMSPLAYEVTDSIVKGIRFEGKINGGKMMGGLSIYLKNSIITNVTIKATFESAIDNVSEIGGISTYVEGGSLSNLILETTMDAKVADLVSVVATAKSAFYYLWNVSYIDSPYPVYTEGLCINPRNIVVMEPTALESSIIHEVLL